MNFRATDEFVLLASQNYLKCTLTPSIDNRGVHGEVGRPNLVHEWPNGLEMQPQAQPIYKINSPFVLSMSSLPGFWKYVSPGPVRFIIEGN